LGTDNKVHTSANTNAGWSLTSSGAYASKEADWDGTKSLSLELPSSPVARFVTVVATVPVGEPIERRFVQRGDDDTSSDIESYLLFDKIVGLENGKIPASGNVIKFVLTGNYEGHVTVTVKDAAKVKDAPTEAEVTKGEAAANEDGTSWSVALSIPSTTESRELTFEVTSNNGTGLFIPGTMLPSYTQDAPSN
jgi:hypothetical protein